MEAAFARLMRIRTLRTQGRRVRAMMFSAPTYKTGTMLPIAELMEIAKQIAGFTVPEARTLVISPYDKSSLGIIERAIRDSDLGVNPSNDGKVLRCVFPELTEERRKEYIKLARGKAEDGRVSVRNVRRTAKQALEKLGAEAYGVVVVDVAARVVLVVVVMAHVVLRARVRCAHPSPRIRTPA